MWNYALLVLMFQTKCVHGHCMFPVSVCGHNITVHGGLAPTHYSYNPNKNSNSNTWNKFYKLEFIKAWPKFVSTFFHCPCTLDLPFCTMLQVINLPDWIWEVSTLTISGFIRKTIMFCSLFYVLGFITKNAFPFLKWQNKIEFVWSSG